MCKTQIKRWFINMIFNNPFVLASSSNSRYKILKNNNLLFSTCKPKCNEDFYKKRLLLKKTPPRKISLELARVKSNSVSKKIKNKLILGSDTVISLNGVLINKAKNLKEAKKKIKKLSGKSHHIYSSASVFYNNKEVWSGTQKTKVKIRKLSNHEIDYYLLKTKRKIIYSVGCYEIESLGPNIIEEIKGDFFNVMGFPLFPFLSFLKKYSIKTK